MSGNFLKKFIKKDNIDDKQFDLLYENALTGFNNAYVPYSVSQMVVLLICLHPIQYRD